jgi:hypothetical protein
VPAPESNLIRAGISPFEPGPRPAIHQHLKTGNGHTGT